MSVLQNCVNAVKQIVHNQPSYRTTSFFFIYLRPINTMHQFKLKTVIKYPKRDIPKDTQMENLLLEQRNIHQTTTRLAERKNYYSILGLRKGATLKDIKKAYYVLAKKYHPDSSTGFAPPEDAKKFQEISEAYRVLSDDSKRLEYDLYGIVKNIRKILPDMTARNDEQKLHEMFDEVGYAQDGKHYEPPTPIEIPDEVTLKLTFLQSVRGTTKNMVVKTMNKCHSCAGITGQPLRRNLVLCSKCNGSGVQAITTDAHMVRGPCKVCNGQRYIPQRLCSECNGRGVILINKQIEVNIPAGVHSGDIIRVPHPNKKQYIAARILVVKSEDFARIGNDIFSELPVSLTQAVLGGVIKVKGIDDEDHKITLEPGTESNAKIRLAGRGVQTASGIGDHIVTIKIKVPKMLTTRQRALMAAFAETEAGEPDLKAEYRKSKIRDELVNLHQLNKPKTSSKPQSNLSKPKLSNGSSTKRMFDPN